MWYMSAWMHRVGNAERSGERCVATRGTVGPSDRGGGVDEASCSCCCLSVVPYSRTKGLSHRPTCDNDDSSKTFTRLPDREFHEMFGGPTSLNPSSLPPPPL